MELKAQLGELGTCYNSSSFWRQKKMANIDIDPFGNHNNSDAQPDEPTGKTILLIPGGVGGSTWEPECEMSLGGTRLRMEVQREHVEALYHALTKYLG